MDFLIEDIGGDILHNMQNNHENMTRGEIQTFFRLLKETNFAGHRQSAHTYAFRLQQIKNEKLFFSFCRDVLEMYSNKDLKPNVAAFDKKFVSLGVGDVNAVLLRSSRDLRELPIGFTQRDGKTIKRVGTITDEFIASLVIDLLLALYCGVVKYESWVKWIAESADTTSPKFLRKHLVAAINNEKVDVVSGGGEERRHDDDDGSWVTRSSAKSGVPLGELTPMLGVDGAYEQRMMTVNKMLQLKLAKAEEHETLLESAKGVMGPGHATSVLPRSVEDAVSSALGPLLSAFKTFSARLDSVEKAQHRPKQKQKQVKSREITLTALKTGGRSLQGESHFSDSSQSSDFELPSRDDRNSHRVRKIRQSHIDSPDSSLSGDSKLPSYTSAVRGENLSEYSVTTEAEIKRGRACGKVSKIFNLATEPIQQHYLVRSMRDPRGLPVILGPSGGSGILVYSKHEGAYVVKVTSGPAHRPDDRLPQDQLDMLYPPTRRHLDVYFKDVVDHIYRLIDEIDPIDSVSREKLQLWSREWQRFSHKINRLISSRLGQDQSAIGQFHVTNWSVYARFILIRSQYAFSIDNPSALNQDLEIHFREQFSSLVKDHLMDCPTAEDLESALQFCGYTCGFSNKCKPGSCQFFCRTPSCPANASIGKSATTTVDKEYQAWLAVNTGKTRGDYFKATGKKVTTSESKANVISSSLEETILRLSKDQKVIRPLPFRFESRY
jgi:hypothetical protein